MREVVPDAILVAQSASHAGGEAPRRSRRAALLRTLGRLGGGDHGMLRQDWVSRLTGFAPRVQSVGRIDFAPVTVALRELAPDWLLLVPEQVSIQAAVLGTLAMLGIVLQWQLLPAPRAKGEKSEQEQADEHAQKQRQATDIAIGKGKFV